MTQNTSPIQVLYPESVPGLRKLWTYTTGDAIVTSPVVAGEVVYIGSEDSHVYALEARTGKKLWSFKTGGAIISSPAVVNGIVYVGSNDRSLYAFNHLAISSAITGVLQEGS